LTSEFSGFLGGFPVPAEQSAGSGVVVAGALVVGGSRVVVG